MLVGVDFDNTIVSYDQVFHKIALEKGWITPEVPVSKGKVRDFMRECGAEENWIELQGYVYGARMNDAQPYPGVIEFFCGCREKRITVCIISHKTRYPFMGPRYDLHQGAYEWLEVNGFFDAGKAALGPDQVYFELTKEEKLGRIARVGCSHFIDDLPEFLAEPRFPPRVERVLFDPNQIYASVNQFHRKTSWAGIEEFISGERLFSS